MPHSHVLPLHDQLLTVPRIEEVVNADLELTST